jgi:hypothetical protein
MFAMNGQKIPNSKFQIPNNFQIPKIQILGIGTFEYLKFDRLFGIWNLEFGRVKRDGISPEVCPRG